MDGVNLIGDHIIIERNAKVLLKACRDIGLRANIRKTKYLQAGRHRGTIAKKHITARSK